MKSLKAIADLARAGVGRHGSTASAVKFRVSHLADRPGAYRDALEEDEKHLYIETLTSAANGAALIVETYVETDVADVRLQSDGDLHPRVVEVDARSRIFEGVAQPNPSFLFEGTTVVECLVTVEPELGPGGGLQRQHGVAMYELILEISRITDEIAKTVGDDVVWPILSLQAPAVVPLDGDDGRSVDEEWPRSSALAVRFSIATGEVSAQARIAFLRRLDGYCRDHGLGLWASDLRPNHRAGNWRRIRPHDAVVAARESRGAPSATDDELVSVLPMTLVGPARAGTTRATLESFGDRRPAIVASSITALDDLTFIHFQLGLTSDEAAQLARTPRADGGQMVPRATCPLRELGPVMATCKVDLSFEDVPEALSGFAPLCGPIIDIATDRLSCRPVWLAWEVDSSQAGLKNMIPALSMALDRLVASAVEEGRLDPDCLEGRQKDCYPNIEYLISRDLSIGSVRAKGKLQVPDKLLMAFPLQSNPGEASWGDRGVAVATTIEDNWKIELTEARIEPRELRVAWREWWLEN